MSSFLSGSLNHSIFSTLGVRYLKEKYTSTPFPWKFNHLKDDCYFSVMVKKINWFGHIIPYQSYPCVTIWKLGCHNALAVYVLCWSTHLCSNTNSMAIKEVNEERIILFSVGFFMGMWILSDQFEECLWFACSTFYRKCVMQCGTRTGLVLVLTRSRPALVLVLTRSRPALVLTWSRSALVLVLTLSQSFKVLVLYWSWYTLVLVVSWSRFRWSWLQHCLIYRILDLDLDSVFDQFVPWISVCLALTLAWINNDVCILPGLHLVSTSDITDLLIRLK